MGTGTIVLIIVIVIVALALVGLAAWMSGRKKKEQHHAEAESIRHEATAQAGSIEESQLRAREAEARAEQARLQAQRAEEEAAREHRGVTQEEALHEERIREADRLDPKVDHTADDYSPETSAAATTVPAPDETGRVDSTHAGTAETGTSQVDQGGRPLDEQGRPIEDPSEPGGTHRAP